MGSGDSEQERAANGNICLYSNLQTCPLQQLQLLLLERTVSNAQKVEGIKNVGAHRGLACTQPGQQLEPQLCLRVGLRNAHVGGGDWGVTDSRCRGVGTCKC